MILKKEKIIFVHAPRCSGTSIEAHFLGDKKVPDKIKHLTAADYKNYLKEEWKEYFKFSIIRNPFERVHSMYCSEYYRHIGFLSNKTMKYFLTNFSPPSWERGLQCSDYLNEEVDFIIRYENREEDIQELGKIIGQKINTNILLRPTKKVSRDYKEVFDEETIKMVKNIFKDDFKRFGYDY